MVGSAEAGDDDVGGLASAGSPPGRVRVQDPVQLAVTGSVEGDQVGVGFVAEPVVAAMMQVTAT